MLAFIDNPVAIIVVLVVALLVFGPQKLPEIMKQLGRGVRDFKRATSEFTSAINTEDQPSRYDANYDPKRYDSYGTPYDSTSTVPEEDVYPAQTSESKASAALAAPDAPRGDFAAAALADSSNDYGVGLTAPPTTGTNGASDVHSDIHLAPPKESVPRSEKTT